MEKRDCIYPECQVNCGDTPLMACEHSCPFEMEMKAEMLKRAQVLANIFGRLEDISTALKRLADK